MEVLERAPPYVQTGLTGPGQPTGPNAMLLADYIAEAMLILSSPKPCHGEILVKRVKALRSSGKNDDCEQMLMASTGQ
jgi:short-subunit dehydrogenase involved in D-alanine esterification of teichoic acids